MAVCKVCGTRTADPGVLLKLLDDFSPRRRRWRMDDLDLLFLGLSGSFMSLGMGVMGYLEMKDDRNLHELWPMLIIEGAAGILFCAWFYLGLLT